MINIVCKCGARTYEEHLRSDKPAHAYTPNKTLDHVAAIAEDKVRDSVNSHFPVIAAFLKETR